jgi:alkylation response protein AidB-like acyl-CoA dehydrogenase
MIDLLIDEDQQALIDGANRFLRAKLPVLAERTGDGRGDWLSTFVSQCGQLGWFGLTLDLEVGGVGLSLVEEILLFRELGRVLAPPTLLTTALAAKFAFAAAQRPLADALASGTTQACLGALTPARDLRVWDTDRCNTVLVVDGTERSMTLLERPPTPAGHSRPSIDTAFRITTFSRTLLDQAVLISKRPADSLILVGALLSSAYLVGIAEQTRDDSVTYAKNRVQFGRPIGSFQAVKHRCADMAYRAEMAWSQVIVAGLRARDAVKVAGFDVSAARVIAVAAALDNARDNIQNHGGIGYTAEASPHLFLKRAHLFEQLFGDERSHLETLVEGDPSW